MTEENISPRMRRMLEKGRKAARDKVVERGIIQFRADPELMSKLLEISEHRKIPLGTMIRNWVEERLESEQIQEPTANIAALADKISAAVLTGLHAAHMVLPTSTAQISLTCAASADFYTGIEIRKRQIDYYSKELAN